MGLTFNTGLLSDAIKSDSSLNVGIGTSTPTKKLEIFSNTSQDGIKISGSSNPRLTIIDTTNSVQFDALTTDTEAVLRTDTNHPLLLSTNGTERMRITAAGNVGIGTSSPDFPLTIASASSANTLKLLGRTDGGSNLSFTNQAGTSTYGSLEVGASYFFVSAYGSSPYGIYTGGSERMRITSGGNVGIGTSSPPYALSVVQNTGDWIGQYKNYGSAAYGLQIDLSGSTGGTGGFALGVYTQAGTGFFLKNNGQVGIGTTSPGNALSIVGDMSVTRNSSGNSIASFSNNNSGGYGVSIGAGSGGQWALIVQNYAGTNRFYVTGDGNLYATNTTISPISSDVNLKTDIVNYDKGLSEILAMKPRYFKYKDNLDEVKAGFIAQEMEIALPNSMKDGMPDKNGDVYKTYEVNWYPLLVKAIQELSAKVSALENKS
jgi:hypothetical protein